MVGERDKFVGKSQWQKRIVVHVASQLVDVCQDDIQVAVIGCRRGWLGSLCRQRQNVHPPGGCLEDQLRAEVGTPPVTLVWVRLTRNDIAVDVLVTQQQHFSV